MVLKRLVKAVPNEAGDKFVEQRMQGSQEDLRPDLVIRNTSDSTAHVIDVTIPFEGEKGSFEWVVVIPGTKKKMRKW